MQEIISVIVPVYNVENYLKKCIDSIINQTYKNLEIILINDGSKDGSGKICDEYAKKDSRIKVIHKENSGVADVRNMGLDIATSDYLLFVDSDDYISHMMIQKLYDKMVLEDPDICMCNYHDVSEDYQIIDKDKNPVICETTLDNTSDIFEHYMGEKHSLYVLPVNKLYKRKLFDGIRYKRGMVYEDELLSHHLVGKCKKVSFVNECLYYYVQTQGSITRSEFSLRKMDAAEAILDRIEYALNINNQSCAEKSFKCVVGYLVVGYKKLDLKDQKTKERMNELKGYFDRLYPEAIKTVKSGVWRKLLFLFLTFPHLYCFLYGFYSVVREGRKKLRG